MIEPYGVAAPSATPIRRLEPLTARRSVAPPVAARGAPRVRPKRLGKPAPSD